MVSQLTDREDGFSLTELIVVMALLGIILAISYGGLQAVYASRDVSDRQATFAREVSTPLNAIEEVLTQALTIENATEYSMTVLTDADNDDSVERHVISCNSDGTLSHERWNTNSSRVNVDLAFDATWSENNVNIADVSPMYTYFDEDGAEISNIALAASDAKVVRVNIRVEVDERAYQDSRLILMRNR